MTQDEIIRMAREAGFEDYDSDWHMKRLERFASLVAAQEKKFWMEQIEVECNEAVLAEREACAKVCENRWMGDLNREDVEARKCAEAIRQRGEK